MNDHIKEPSKQVLPFFSTWNDTNYYINLSKDPNYQKRRQEEENKKYYETIMRFNVLPQLLKKVPKKNRKATRKNRKHRKTTRKNRK